MFLCNLPAHLTCPFRFFKDGKAYCALCLPSVLRIASSVFPCEYRGEFIDVSEEGSDDWIPVDWQNLSSKTREETT